MKKGITLIAVLAAVLAVTSGAFAAANHYLITSSSQIKDGAVSAADLSPAARNALQGQKGNTGAAGRQGPAGAQGLKGDTGATGAQGPKGDTGATGAQGPKGSAAHQRVRGSHLALQQGRATTRTRVPAYAGVGSGAIATVACSPGKVALSGGYRFTSAGDNGFNSSAIADGSGVVASFPGRMDWNTNTVKPNDNSGWIVQVNNKVDAADMTLYVVCVNAS